MPQTAEMQRRYTRGDVARAVAIAMALGGYLFILCVGGASPLRFVSFSLCAAVCLVGPGLALADWLGLHEPALRAPLAMLYGIGFLVVVHCFAVRLGILWLLRLLPAAVTAVWALQKLRARRAAGLPLCPRLPGVWKNGVLLWAVLCLLYGIFLGAVNPHPLAAGGVDLNQDLLWNVGNATALSRHFPAQDIHFLRIRFSYHYLTELLVAALHLLSGAAVYDIDTFFAGPLFLAGELAALCSLGRHYFGEGRERLTHGMVGILFGCQSLAMWQVSAAGNDIFGNTLLKHLITNINAQATALVLACVFTVLFIVISRRHFAVGPLYLLDLVAAFSLLCVAKGPQAAIVLCSLAITMGLVLLFQRPRYGRALLCLAGCAAAFAVIYQFLFAAEAHEGITFTIFSMQESPTYRFFAPYTDRLRKLIPAISGYVWLVLIGVANSFCMLPFQFLLWVAGLPEAIKHLFRLDPARILANGVAVGGFLAFHLFSQTGSSEIYFALIGMVFMTLLATEQLDRLLRTHPHAAWKWPIWLAGGASAVTAACILLACTGNAVTQLGATLGVRPATGGVAQASPADEAAMLWLDANTDAETVFTTNRTGASPQQNNGISNVYTAFGGRQAYMEGWVYALPDSEAQRAQVNARLAVNAVIFDPATPLERLRAVCAGEGITCIVRDKAWPGDICPALPPVYANEDVAIYLLG